jgi:hypothetical protein
MSHAPVIVYGPKGCGKTRNADRIRRHFGCRQVVDGWMPGEPLVAGAVHLTCEVPTWRSRFVVPYESLPATVRGQR